MRDMLGDMLLKFCNSTFNSNFIHNKLYLNAQFYLIYYDFKIQINDDDVQWPCHNRPRLPLNYIIVYILCYLFI